MKFHFGLFDGSEICIYVSFTPREVMWALIMKLPHTEAKFYLELKYQTGLSSLRVSCKRAHRLFILETKINIVIKKANKKTVCVVTIAMICSNFVSLWKFQYFWRPIYNLVKHLWWSFYCKNSKPLSIFTKKLHRRCLLGF